MLVGEALYRDATGSAPADARTTCEMIRHDGTMLVDGGQYLLFDLRDDPGERHDLAAQHHDLVVLLKGKIADWEKAVDRRTPSQ
ncbi:MAG: hypothetical protein DMF97_06650 [Acidobacteria bacterium]|nr:MAG: hypothetical protein DMF97_06650 [Acidobacteriota bacterium]PYR22421.1 MAG: hypothetical protein DMF98_20280 [Acidobacteriota bacterium]